MTAAKRPALPDLRPPAREAADDRRAGDADDDAIKGRLRVAARDLGFGGPAAGHPAAAAVAAPAARAATAAAVTRSIQLVVPDYLFEEMGLKAVRRRVTKRFLILEALAAAGYRVEPGDLDEDGRRRR